MTPKEKAQELINKFEDVDECYDHFTDQPYLCKHQAKQCAIICVELIIQSLDSGDDPEHTEYWQNVLSILKNS